MAQAQATRRPTSRSSLKEAEAALDAKAYAQYPKLTEAEIKTLVVDDKWLAALDAAIHGEMDRVSQQLTQRVKELAERYEDAAAADDRPRRRTGGQGEPPPGEDGFLMDVKPGYKQTEVGVIPDGLGRQPTRRCDCSVMSSQRHRSGH